MNYKAYNEKKSKSESVNGIVATMEDTSNQRGIALTLDISYKGLHVWFKQEKMILDLGGCDNLVNLDFVNQNLKLAVQIDSSLAAQFVQQSVSGDKFHFRKFVEIWCNFKGHREKVKFYLMDNLPLSFLPGFPFFVKKGAIFDLTRPTVLLMKTENKPEMNLISMSSESFSAFYSFSVDPQPSSDINSLFCTF